MDRRGFGSSALSVYGSILAMLSRGRLVVKLPRDRVDALIESWTGGPFDAGKGRPMKEWLTVAVDAEETWMALAREALDFVGSRTVKARPIHPAACTVSLWALAYPVNSGVRLRRCCGVPKKDEHEERQSEALESNALVGEL